MKNIKTNLEILDDSYEMNSFQYNDQRRKVEEKNVRN